MRVRPLSEQEAEKGPAWKIDSNKILPLAQGGSSDIAYTLDNVFGSEWTTREVYDRTTEDIIRKVLFPLPSLQVLHLFSDCAVMLGNQYVTLGPARIADFCLENCTAAYNIVSL